MPVIPDKKIDQPERTVINVVALLTRFHGHIATEMITSIKHPLRILIQRGQRAAMSMPVEIQLRTMQSES
jgi:hypothetical protein